MIRIDNLTKKYGTKTAVDGLSLVVPDGSIYGLLGPNGAGKSTTMKMMVGILHPDSGDVSYDDFSILTKPRGRFLIFPTARICSSA